MGFRNPLNFPPGSITGAMLGDGSVSGPKLTFDAIDGKTITGAKVRTAAPPAMRWELTSDTANLLRAFTGAAGETAPGGVLVGTGGSPGSVQLLAPAFAGVAPASVALNQLDAGGTSEVILSSRSGGGVLEDSADPTNDLQWIRGTLYKDTAWSNLARVNGWVDFAGSRAQYLKDAAGNVYLRGVVASGTAVLIATLPTDYRPKQACEFAMRGGSATGVMTVVGVDTTGQVTVLTNLATAQTRLPLDLVFSTI